MAETSLQSFLSDKHRAFSAKVGQSFIQNKRITDFKAEFALLIHKYHPADTQILWRQKDTGPIKLLLQQFPPERLVEMITAYAKDALYHQQTGLSFGSFYAQHAKIAFDLAANTKKTTVVKQRKALSEAPALTDAELAIFAEEGDRS